MASEGYLSQRDEIIHPSQLASYSCITHRAWSECTLRKGKSVFHWSASSRHITDNLLYARQCAISGGGIALLPAFLATDGIEQGLLVPVLEDWQAESNELYLVYPERKLNTSAQERLIETVMRHPLVAAHSTKR